MPIASSIYLKIIYLIHFVLKNLHLQHILSLCLNWLTPLFDCIHCTPQSFITASQASTKFVLFTFFGFSSFLFAHFTPSLCHQSHARRSIASSSQSNLQSIESSSRESASSSSKVSTASDSTGSVETVKSKLPASNLNNSVKSIRTSTVGPHTGSTSFPPILSTRFMHFIMQTSLLSRLVGAHIGEPCNSLFKVCLPPSPHIYCDDNLICRCRDDYPGMSSVYFHHLFFVVVHNKSHLTLFSFLFFPFSLPRITILHTCLLQHPGLNENVWQNITIHMIS